MHMYQLCAGTLILGALLALACEKIKGAAVLGALAVVILYRLT